jgi:aminoglycoside/choline kinase family phosphotransferase
MEKILNLCRKSGFADPEGTRLKGDFSQRAIYRVNHSKGTLIAVSGPDILENEAFLSFRNTFERNGFSVPGFIAVSDDRKTYLLEDLGDVTVKSYCDRMIKLGNVEGVKKIYTRIMEKLPLIHTKLSDRIDYSKCYQYSVFGRENMESDIERFEEYFLKRYHKNYDPARFQNFRNELISSADNYGKNYFLYRDFQTRNIMIKNNDLYFIDFQSGRKGSFYYDIASFIYSSGTVKFEGMEDELSKAYFKSSRHIDCDIDSFRTGIGIFALLRIMQAVGNYAFYYYDRKDNSITSKKQYGLKTIINLSRSLNIESGIYEG